jgi:hypothetical protein
VNRNSQIGDFIGFIDDGILRLENGMRLATILANIKEMFKYVSGSEKLFEYLFRIGGKLVFAYEISILEDSFFESLFTILVVNSFLFNCVRQKLPS